MHTEVDSIYPTKHDIDFLGQLVLLVKTIALDLQSAYARLPDLALTCCLPAADQDTDLKCYSSVSTVRHYEGERSTTTFHAQLRSSSFPPVAGFAWN